ncbi:hypothetical protein [Polaromonas sp. CG_23.6]|uniref:hypothetical protein n=1 Tax=Polaromonas sp. CG_23.6 TaxID=2760709 RepID=UPI0024733665|nr:hypothetical protein [Polaromonas sp. CG_23.6]MDH6186746.1 hypothetical protein [Polaromonas sp. CG_23.6]
MSRVDTVTIEQWAVIHIEGRGHIRFVSHDRANAILGYAWKYRDGRPGFDFETWWKENAKAKKLVCQKIQVTTKHIPGVPYSGWHKPTPQATCCEWDKGHDAICSVQCENEGKQIVEGHRLCGVHVKTYERHGKLLLATGRAAAK